MWWVVAPRVYRVGESPSHPCRSFGVSNESSRSWWREYQLLYNDMLKKMVCTLLLIALPMRAVGGVASADTIDNVTLTAPKGWKMTQQHGVTVYQKDPRKGIGLVMIYPRVAATTSPMNDFMYVWKSLVAEPFAGSAQPKITTTERSASLVMQGASAATYQKSDVVAFLSVFSNDGYLTSVLGLFNGEADLAEIQAVTQSVVFSNTKVNAGLGSSAKVGDVTASMDRQAPTPRGNSSALQGKSIEGVWTSIEPEVVGTKINADTQYRVFFNNGRSLSLLPATGLLNYDVTTESKFSVGRFTVAKRSGVNFTTPVAASKEVLKITSTTRLKVGATTFYKCASVDGKRLNATYTTVGDVKGTDFSSWPEGQRPTITFDKNGTFVDHGIFTNLLFTSYNASQDIAGGGQYDLVDFTLVLRYSDGHVRRVAFNFFLDATPSLDPSMVYFSRVALSKLP